MYPAEGSSLPVSKFMRVDFPAPLGPNSATICPGSKSNVTPSIATVVVPCTVSSVEGPDVPSNTLRTDLISTRRSSSRFPPRPRPPPPCKTSPISSSPPLSVSSPRPPLLLLLNTTPPPSLPRSSSEDTLRRGTWSVASCGEGARRRRLRWSEGGRQKHTSHASSPLALSK